MQCSPELSRNKMRQEKAKKTKRKNEHIRKPTVTKSNKKTIEVKTTSKNIKLKPCRYRNSHSWKIKSGGKCSGLQLVAHKSCEDCPDSKPCFAETFTSQYPDKAKDFSTYNIYVNVKANSLEQAPEQDIKAEEIDEVKAQEAKEVDEIEQEPTF
jgi:hypothetical protein